MHSEGVLCTIGTDGTCSNNDLDMWDEMRTASFLQKVATMDPCVLPAYEILKMATVNAARAIGHAGELGVIKAIAEPTPAKSAAIAAPNNAKATPIFPITKCPP